MRWKQIEKHPDFYVSDTGLVWAKETITIRTNGASLRKKERFIKVAVGKKGYPIVRLSRHGKDKTYTVHRLVAQAFVSNPNKYIEVNHEDGDKTNNNYQNLVWCTRGYNIKHAFASGLRTVDGDSNPNRKLSALDVIDIRKRKVRGEKMTYVLKDYTVSIETIRRAATGQNWQSVPMVTTNFK